MSFPRGTGIIEVNEEGVSHGDPSLRVVSWALEKGGEITVIQEARPEAVPMMW